MLLLPYFWYFSFNFSTSLELADGATSSWLPVNEGFPSPLVTSICIDPTNSQVLYLGTAGGGIYKSINGGSSWTIINEGLTTLDVFSIAIDESNTNVIYAAQERASSNQKMQFVMANAKL